MTPTPMSQTARTFTSLGAALAALAVILGAFGAHALQAMLPPDLLSTYHTATQYHFYHALGLIAIGLVSERVPGDMVKGAGWLMVAGTILFSGSLYVLAATGIRVLGAITPFGGLALIIAWIMLAIAIVRLPK